MTWLKSHAYPPPKLARWLLKLSEYDFTIKHRSGKQNANADALSRLPTQEDGNPQVMERPMAPGDTFLFHRKLIPSTGVPDCLRIVDGSPQPTLELPDTDLVLTFQEGGTGKESEKESSLSGWCFNSSPSQSQHGRGILTPIAPTNLNTRLQGDISHSPDKLSGENFNRDLPSIEYRRGTSSSRVTDSGAQFEPLERSTVLEEGEIIVLTDSETQSGDEDLPPVNPDEPCVVCEHDHDHATMIVCEGCNRMLHMAA